MTLKKPYSACMVCCSCATFISASLLLKNVGIDVIPECLSNRDLNSKTKANSTQIVCAIRANIRLSDGQDSFLHTTRTNDINCPEDMLDASNGSKRGKKTVP